VWLVVSVPAALLAYQYRCEDQSEENPHERVHLVSNPLLCVKLGIGVVGIQDNLKNILLDLTLLSHCCLSIRDNIFRQFDEAW